MRPKFLLLLFLLISVFGFGQDLSYDLLQNKSQTQILYNRVYQLSKATSLKTENTSVSYFRQVFSEISRSDFQHRLPESSYLKQQADWGITQGIIPVSLLVADFENIPVVAFDAGKVSKNQNGKFVMNASADEVFENYQIGLMGALLGRTDSKNPVLVLKSNLIYNLSDRPLESVEVFNQNTWQTIEADVPFQLSFNQTGNQKLKYRINYADGESVTQSFALEVRDIKRASSAKTNDAFSTDEIHTITSTIPFKGYDESQAFNGQGEYEVYLDTVDGVLDRPVILVDGFDPGDSRGIDSLYHMLDYGNSNENLADLIRAEGYDVILLNFPVYSRSEDSTVVDGGVDYIQRNAMILVELINQLNQQKVGNKQNVVIGPSMGGLITRYALRYMEMNSLNHDTRLYISFDAPHLGANVPIGFQHLFNYMAYGPFGDESVQLVVDGMLKSPAAREMLIDHFEGHLQSGSTTEFDPNLLLPVGSPGFRDMFQNELDIMGFPTQTRNVAIINGAGDGTKNGNPGMTVIDHIFNVSDTQRAVITVNFTPTVNQTAEVSHFKGQQWILFWITFFESAASSKATTTSHGIDASPGGRFDLSGIADSAPDNDLIDEFIENLQIEYFSFIPSVSSMAITQTQNYYSNITGGMNTPFVNYYIPSENQKHVYLDDGNVDFALDEILIDEMAVTESFAGKIQIENPVRDELKIYADKEYKNVSVKIIDMNGRTVYQKNNLNLNGSLSLPVNLNKGSFVVQLQNGKETITKKIIKI